MQPSLVNKLALDQTLSIVESVIPSDWIDNPDQDKYVNDPVLWVQERLSGFVWSKQREILQSVRDNRRTCVKSCHGAGKSYTAGLIAAWWIDSHKPGEAKVITSAPTGDQVRAILWQEISRAHAKGNLPGRLNQTEWWLQIGDREEMVGIGRKPAEHNAAALQGWHERYVLLILDEADGIDKTLWDQGDGLLSNDDCRLLAIGNPEDPSSEFANECKPGSGSHVIQISAFDTPNFTGENVPDELKHRLVGKSWVEEKKRKWGENNPLYISKVLGEFPEINTDSLIPIKWVRLAQERDLREITKQKLLEGRREIPNELGCDVGGGRNHSTITHRLGAVARVVHDDRNPDTMQTLSAILAKLEQTGATQAKIDMIGIGLGAAQRAKEIANDQAVKRDTPDIAERAAKVIGVDVRRKANDNEHFINLRAEGYWSLRERFNPENELRDPLSSIDIDPDDDDLAAQLLSIKSKSSSGRIQIEEKTQPSPDKADSVMLAFLEVEVKGEGEYYTW